MRLHLVRPSQPSAGGAGEPHVGDLLAGRYWLRRRLAASRSSDVWQAWDEVLGCAVAVKHLEDRVEAEEEARAATAVTHPGVVRVHDVVDDGTAGAWLIMEHLSGGSLAAVLREEHRLGEQEVAYIGSHVLDALEALHTAGLVHRDVKPSNLQLCGDARVVLMDFGLATAPCVTGGADDAPIAGSLPYLAPEILQHGHYSAASDLFALGVTMLFSVTGQTLSQLSYQLQTSNEIRLGGGASKLGEHPALLPVIVALLEPRPAHRLPSQLARRLLEPHNNSGASYTDSGLTSRVHAVKGVQSPTPVGPPGGQQHGETPSPEQRAVRQAVTHLHDSRPCGSLATGRLLKQSRLNNDDHSVRAASSQDGRS